MPTPESLPPQKPGFRRWPWIVGACVPFGILKALRETSPSIWLRAAIAGSAFVILGFSYRAMKEGE